MSKPVIPLAVLCLLGAVRFAMPQERTESVPGAVHIALTPGNARAGENMRAPGVTGRSDHQQATPLWRVGAAALDNSTPGSASSHKAKAVVIGGIVGFGVGAALGVTLGAEACLNEPRWHSAVKGGVSIAAIGAVAGWLRK